MNRQQAEEMSNAAYTWLVDTGRWKHRQENNPPEETGDLYSDPDAEMCPKCGQVAPPIITQRGQNQCSNCLHTWGIPTEPEE